MQVVKVDIRYGDLQFGVISRGLYINMPSYIVMNRVRKSYESNYCYDMSTVGSKVSL